jgi:hypothetical protein
VGGAGRAAGTTAVLNAANEVAVAAFLTGASAFDQIHAVNLRNFGGGCCPPIPIRSKPCWRWTPARAALQRNAQRLASERCFCCMELSPC